jgi:hypothetical protein
MEILSKGRDSEVSVSINSTVGGTYDVVCFDEQVRQVDIYDAWLFLRQLQNNGYKVPTKFVVNFAELAIQQFRTCANKPIKVMLVEEELGGPDD